jgi:hypothetical protein
VQPLLINFALHLDLVGGRLVRISSFLHGQRYYSPVLNNLNQTHLY